MKRTTKKKMELKASTIRQLQAASLHGVEGGAQEAEITGTCGSTCSGQPVCFETGQTRCSKNCGG